MQDPIFITIGEMAESNRDAIKRFWTELERINLEEVNLIVDYLYQSCKCDKYNYQKMKAQYTTRDKMTSILNMLNLEEERTFTIFLQALEYAGYSNITHNIWEQYQKNKELTVQENTIPKLVDQEITELKVVHDDSDISSLDNQDSLSTHSGVSNESSISFCLFDDDEEPLTRPKKGIKSSGRLDKNKTKPKVPDSATETHKKKVVNCRPIDRTGSLGNSRRCKRRIELAEETTSLKDLGICLAEKSFADGCEAFKYVYIETITEGSLIARSALAGIVQKGFRVYKINGALVTDMASVQRANMDGNRLTMIQSFTVLPQPSHTLPADKSGLASNSNITSLLYTGHTQE